MLKLMYHIYTLIFMHVGFVCGAHASDNCRLVELQRVQRTRDPYCLRHAQEGDMLMSTYGYIVRWTRWSATS